MNRTLLILSSVLVLAACGERAQTMGGARSDAPAYTGTGKAFVVSGWKQGDKTSWESELKARAENSQNEYNRIH